MGHTVDDMIGQRSALYEMRHLVLQLILGPFHLSISWDEIQEVLCTLTSPIKLPTHLLSSIHSSIYQLILHFSINLFAHLYTHQSTLFFTYLGC